MENILYLGGPNIASEIYNKEYANARICGAEKWRKPLAKFLRQPHFIVWDNSDLVTHEVMGGLKNVYAIGAGKLQISYYSFTHNVKLVVIHIIMFWHVECCLFHLFIHSLFRIIMHMLGKHAYAVMQISQKNCTIRRKYKKKHLHLTIIRFFQPCYI